jgi:hypothetical protein
MNQRDVAELERLNRLEVERIARELTKAQHTALWNLGTSPGHDGWQPAPHDGWRRSGQACSNLCRVGLSDRRMNGRTNPPEPQYRLTPFGIRVRQYLNTPSGER